MKILVARSNGRAARDTVLWLVLLVVTGLIAWQSWGSWWALPAFALYGVMYGSASDSRWDECGHRTAFRSRLLNDVVFPSGHVVLEPGKIRVYYGGADTFLNAADFSIDRILGELEPC